MVSAEGTDAVAEESERVLTVSVLVEFVCDAVAVVGSESGENDDDDEVDDMADGSTSVAPTMTFMLSAECADWEG